MGTKRYRLALRRVSETCPDLDEGAKAMMVSHELQDEASITDRRILDYFGDRVLSFRGYDYYRQISAIRRAKSKATSEPASIADEEKCSERMPDEGNPPCEDPALDFDPGLWKPISDEQFSPITLGEDFEEEKSPPKPHLAPSLLNNFVEPKKINTETTLRVIFMRCVV